MKVTLSYFTESDEWRCDAELVSRWDTMDEICNEINVFNERGELLTCQLVRGMKAIFS